MIVNSRLCLCTKGEQYFMHY